MRAFDHRGVFIKLSGPCAAKGGRALPIFHRGSSMFQWGLPIFHWGSSIFGWEVACFVFRRAFFFSEEFKSKGIAIEKYAGELFVPIAGLSEAEKLEKIKAVYGEFCKEANPLRHQIKRMKIELKDLLQPILNV